MGKFLAWLGRKFPMQPPPQREKLPCLPLSPSRPAETERCKKSRGGGMGGDGESALGLGV